MDLFGELERIIDMSESILDREHFFQQEMDKFPAFLHLYGDKERIGYIIFYITHVIWIAFYPVRFWFLYHDIRAVYLAGLVLGIPFFLETLIRHYCVKNGHNTALCVVLVISIPWRFYTIFFRFDSRSDPWTILFVMFSLLLSVWLVAAVFIRGRSMRVACERYKMTSDFQTEKYRRKITGNMFESSESEAVDAPAVSVGTTFVDDEPNWNSKVVMKPSSCFCPKCGFGLLEGESECHVCGTKVTE